jgi:hemerythrin superfamily protein
MADTAVKSTEDVVTFLKRQHETIKTLFAETLRESDPTKREEKFTALRTLLAVHETAEEMVVHPRARREIASGDDIVDARLLEENEAKKKLAAIEKLDIGSEEFITALTELQGAVLDHAQQEEQQEFAKLGRELDEEQLKRMTGAVRAAEAIAPTHPHAGVESAKLNFAAGPFASMLDRARDLIAAAVK